jgi:CHAD domain-containing protein
MVALNPGSAVRLPRNPHTLAELVGGYLDEQREAIVRGDVVLRLDHDAVHATRVATRRYRSVLRVLEPAFADGRARELERELAWFGRALGEVRDRQVLRAHLDQALDDLPPELVVGPVRERIHRALDDEQSAAGAELEIVMRSRRYADLITRLGEWGDVLPIAAEAPAADLADYLARAERDVERRRSKVPAGDGRDQALHEVRKAAKRARYVAELSRPALGERAQAAAKAQEEWQIRLGKHQDGVVAAEFLERLAAEAAAAGEDVSIYALLCERERNRSR